MWLETQTKGSSPIVTISPRIMNMLFFAGLRGAVAFSCANIFPEKSQNKGLVLSTTVVIILVTVIIQGGLTDCLLTWQSIDSESTKLKKVSQVILIFCLTTDNCLISERKRR